jgi:hypothetical protein
MTDQNARLPRSGSWERRPCIAFIGPRTEKLERAERYKGRCHAPAAASLRARRREVRAATPHIERPRRSGAFP